MTVSIIIVIPLLLLRIFHSGLWVSVQGFIVMVAAKYVLLVSGLGRSP